MNFHSFSLSSFLYYSWLFICHFFFFQFNLFFDIFHLTLQRKIFSKFYYFFLYHLVLLPKSSSVITLWWYSLSPSIVLLIYVHFLSKPLDFFFGKLRCRQKQIEWILMENILDTNTNCYNEFEIIGKMAHENMAILLKTGPLCRTPWCATCN